MITIEQTLARWMSAAFGKAFPDAVSGIGPIGVVSTASAEFGDYQCNQAMALGKLLKKAPREIAQAVVSVAEAHECVERTVIAGPGFINIFLSTAWLARFAEAAESDTRCGVPGVGAGKTVVMDYGSPNITKPLHIGHLRSHNIGSVLDRLHRFLGYRVIADNHLGDWGTQFGITILGYRKFGDAQAMSERPLEELERVYVKSYTQGEQDPDWRDQCRRELVKLQNGDPENLA